MYQEYPYLGCINGCNWDVSESLNLPSNLKSGMYTIGILYNKNVCFIPIVIKSKNKSKVLVISNINTWNAYELWVLAIILMKLVHINGNLILSQNINI